MHIKLDGRELAGAVPQRAVTQNQAAKDRLDHVLLGGCLVVGACPRPGLCSVGRPALTDEIEQGQLLNLRIGLERCLVAHLLVLEV